MRARRTVAASLRMVSGCSVASLPKATPCSGETWKTPLQSTVLSAVMASTMPLATGVVGGTGPNPTASGFWPYRTWAPRAPSFKPEQ